MIIMKAILTFTITVIYSDKSRSNTSVTKSVEVSDIQRKDESEILSLLISRAVMLLLLQVDRESKHRYKLEEASVGFKTQQGFEEVQHNQIYLQKDVSELLKTKLQSLPSVREPLVYAQKIPFGFLDRYQY